MTGCLIVDDSVTVRRVLCRLLEDAGFTCAEAENGQEAYNICRGKMPDLIIVDWNMPVMNGLDFVQKLRRTVGGERPKIIFCTSECDIRQMRRAIDAGADEYIMKPFNADILRSKLAHVGLPQEKRHAV